MSELFNELNTLSTEQRNPRSMNLDSMNTRQILELINDEDAKVAMAVRAELPYIEKVGERLGKSADAARMMFHRKTGEIMPRRSSD